jgi:hypothetical protein
MTEERIKEIIRWHGLSPETLAIAYREGRHDERDRCYKICRPNLIGEHPAGSGKDDRYDLARADMANAIMTEQP